MSAVAAARSVALTLPQTTEEDHHGITSFRVSGRIFATVPDAEHVRVMVDEAEIHAAVSEHPDVCEEFYWGKRLACVVVHTPKAPRDLLPELLTEAWLRKAPPSLRREFRGPT